MEGGNYAYDSDGNVTDLDDLSLLTHHRFADGALLTTMRDTSAATALAAGTPPCSRPNTRITGRKPSAGC